MGQEKDAEQPRESLLIQQDQIIPLSFSAAARIGQKTAAPRRMNRACSPHCKVSQKEIQLKAAMLMALTPTWRCAGGSICLFGAENLSHFCVLQHMCLLSAGARRYWSSPVIVLQDYGRFHPSTRGDGWWSEKAVADLAVH
jgi:hypothetical protein